MSNRSPSKIQVLIYDTDGSVARHLRSILEDTYECTVVSDPDDESGARVTGSFRIVFSGQVSAGTVPSPDILLIAIVETVSQGVEAVLAGAFDFITRPLDPDLVRIIASRAVVHCELLSAKRDYEDRLEKLAGHSNAAGGLADREALDTELRLALDRGEFELYYQPKIDATSDAVVGMEALVRWNHPELGVVLPSEFIHAAERSGLIIPLGAWILREACERTRTWHEQGLKLQVAVNISPWQVYQEDFPETIVSIVRDTGFDPSFLNLEITESSIMYDTASAVDKLRKLRTAGISISIDDFGTGHSSLRHLKHLPIDVLKIDKSFVDDVTHDQDDAAVVMAIITLAHTLRLKVVGEGVETAEQLRFLRLLRCDEWQGLLFSGPVPAGEFIDVVRSRM